MRVLLGMGFVKFLMLAGVTYGAALAQEAAAPQTYYEFGTVFAVGNGNIALRVYDAQKHTVVQHVFLLSKDTRADVVRVGDVVEVIYTADGGRMTAKRLLLTGGAVPKEGGPPSAAVGTKVAANSPANNPAGSRKASVAPNPATGAKAPVGGVNLGKTLDGKVPGAVSVGLGEKAEGKVPTATALNLGGAEASKPRMPVAKAVEHDTPAEECHRSDASWASQPIRIGVMDFRYPTEKEEESADMTAKGGGSGTLVADLVFDRLGQNPDYLLGRGDRDKLYRGDFAGAARLGRQMGVDAVLAGTFQPVEQAKDQDGFSVGPKTYELKAGLVDTCTGQLLMRLVSVKCADGSIPDVGGPSGPAQGCTRYRVTAKQAADPRDDPRSFGPALDSLIGPLVAGTTTPAAGGGPVVTAVSGAQVMVSLPGGTRAKVGDTLAIHATRLAKNMATDTLKELHDEEIGRMVVTGVQGGMCTGNFTGEYAPKVGDGALMP